MSKTGNSKLHTDHEWNATVLFRQDAVDSIRWVNEPMLLMVCTVCGEERVLQGEKLAKG